MVVVTRMPLRKPVASPRARASDDAEDDRGSPVSRHDGEGHRARGEHRADREVELAGDHEQANRDGDDAQLGGDVQPARCAAGGQELLAAEIAKKTKTLMVPISAPVSGRRSRLPSDARARVAPGPATLPMSWPRDWIHDYEIERRLNGLPVRCPGRARKSWPDTGRCQRTPALAPAIAESTLSALMIAGPVRSGRCGRFDAVLDVADHRHRQVALHVGLLVDAEQLLAVLDAVELGLVHVERAELDRVAHARLLESHWQPRRRRRC